MLFWIGNFPKQQPVYQYLVCMFSYNYRTTNLNILDQLDLVEDDVSRYNSLVEGINSLQSIKKKKVIFLSKIGSNYSGCKTVNKIHVIGSNKNTDTAQFSDEDE